MPKKLNSYSKISQLEEFKYVFVRPILQSEKQLTSEKSTKIENILNNIDSNIKNDIINLSNISLVTKDGEITRVGYRTEKDGKKVRFSRKSNEII